MARAVIAEKSYHPNLDHLGYTSPLLMFFLFQELLIVTHCAPEILNCRTIKFSYVKVSLKIFLIRKIDA